MIAAPRQLSPRAESHVSWRAEVEALLRVEAAARRYARHSHGNMVGTAYRDREEARDCLLDAIAHLDLVRQGAA